MFAHRGFQEVKKMPTVNTRRETADLRNDCFPHTLPFISQEPHESPLLCEEEQRGGKMRAKYYRYLFHKVTEGVCYSGSIRNQMEEEQEDLCFLYLAGGFVCTEKGVSYASEENEYQLLILGDYAPAAIQRACRTARSCRVVEAMIPDGREEEQVTSMLLQAGVERVRVVREEVRLTLCRELLQIVPVREGEESTLAFYHADAKGTPKTEECLASIKPAIEGGECMARADHDKLTCEMRCLLYNDFTLCKRQNQKGCSQFLDGHLLFASAGEGDGSENRGAVLELIGQHRKRLRIVGLPDKDLSSFEIDEIKEIGERGFARWLVGTEKTPAEVVKAITVGDPHRRFFATGEQSGLCISGYYVPRMAEPAILKSL